MDRDRADAPDAEDMGEGLRDLLEVVVAAGLYEDPAIGAQDAEAPLTGAQGDLDLPHQSLLENVAVFSFDADLCIFDQKGVVSVHIVPL